MWCYSEPLEDCLDIRGYVAFYWSKVDAWFEENEQVFFGVKDPYTRVDCLRSNRLIEIYINSLLVAKTCLLYTSPSPRDLSTSRMPSSA